MMSSEELPNGEELEDVGSEEDEEELECGVSTPEKRARHAITGRGVTLPMLMADGIIQPGEGLISLEYLGQKFTADLLPSGKIKSNETGQVFGSPSSWAIFCKKLVNPAKKSGCGWASVKYKGRKLDSWKTSWFRQHRPTRPNIGRASPASSVCSESGHPDVDNNKPNVSTGSNLEMTDFSVSKADNEPVDGQTVEDMVLDLTTKHKPAETAVSGAVSCRPDPTVCFEEEQEEALNLCMKAPAVRSAVKPKSQAPVEVKHENPDGAKERKPVKHSQLPDRSQTVEPNLLVETEKFNNLGKVQPFTVSMSTNSQLLMDFHCHLTTSEVVGYLGGKWDHNTQHLSIQQSFPCKCRLGDSQNAPLVEEDIRQNMKLYGMSLVGWYHSHPYCAPEPSVKDVDCQMAYQLRMKGSKSTYFPCVGVINSPYHGDKAESTSQMYMVMPPPENIQSDYGIPMQLKYSTTQNRSVNEELLAEMKRLVEFYIGAPDWITFQHSWQPSVSYMDKLRGSLAAKLPEDQAKAGTFLEFVEHLLLLAVK